MSDASATEPGSPKPPSPVSEGAPLPCPGSISSRLAALAVFGFAVVTAYLVSERWDVRAAVLNIIAGNDVSLHKVAAMDETVARLDSYVTVGLLLALFSFSAWLKHVETAATTIAQAKSVEPPADRSVIWLVRPYIVGRDVQRITSPGEAVDGKRFFAFGAIWWGSVLLYIALWILQLAMNEADSPESLLRTIEFSLVRGGSSLLCCALSLAFLTRMQRRVENSWREVHGAHAMRGTGAKASLREKLGLSSRRGAAEGSSYDSSKSSTPAQIALGVIVMGYLLSRHCGDIRHERDQRTQDDSVFAAPDEAYVAGEVEVEEARTFAEGLLRTLPECEPTSLARLFDKAYIRRSGLLATDAPPAAYKALEEQGLVPFVDDLLPTRVCFDEFELLDLRVREGRTALLVYASTPVGFDFLEMPLGKDKRTQRISALDVYSYYYGASMKTEIVSFEPVFGVGQKAVAEMSAWGEVLATDAARGWAEYSNLPETLRKSAFVAKLPLYALSQQGQAETFKSAYNSFRSAFPEYPDLALLRLTTLGSGSIELLDSLESRLVHHHRFDALRYGLLAEAPEIDWDAIAQLDAHVQSEHEPSEALAILRENTQVLLHFALYERIPAKLEAILALDEKATFGTLSFAGWDAFAASDQGKAFANAHPGVVVGEPDETRE